VAVITKRIEVCDVCRTVGEPVTRVRVAFGAGRLRTYALCEEHGGPVRELIGHLGSGTISSAPARSSKQVSLDEIESVKLARSPKGRRRSAVPSTGFEKGD